MPREAILEGEVVAYDAAAGELRPFQEVMFRRRKHGIAEAARDVPVALFCFELLYADGRDLTRLSYLDRRAQLAEAVTLSDRLRLTTALDVATAPALDAAFEQAVADGSEGLVCKSGSPDAIYQAGARGWLWIKLKRDYRTELADTVDLVVVGAYAGRGRRRGTYGAVLLAAYDPEAESYQTVGRCGTGFSDAELAALPASWLHTSGRSGPRESTRAFPRMCGSNRASWSRCSAPNSRCRPITPLVGGRSRLTPDCLCGFPDSPGVGGTTRSLRTPRRLSSSWSFIAPHAGRPLGEANGYAGVSALVPATRAKRAAQLLGVRRRR